MRPRQCDRVRVQIKIIVRKQPRLERYLLCTVLECHNLTILPRSLQSVLPLISSVVDFRIVTLFISYVQGVLIVP